MIRINLLPHREEKRKARQKQFITLAAFAALIGLSVAGLLWFVFDSQVENQKGRNKYLTTEIEKLDKEIEEIRKIREETASLLAKKRVVEGLQSNRSDPVYLLDQLLRQLPEGLYLKSIRQTGTKVNVSGYAQSNARVAAFMRNIEASPYLENPNLIEIKAVTINSQRANEFSLDFSLKRPKAEEGGKLAPRTAEPGKPAEKKS
jgi:type IV pilus assembly protein PilN